MKALGASGQSLLREAGPTMSVTSAYRVRGAIGKSYFHSIGSQELEQSTYLRASNPQLLDWKSRALPLASDRKTSLWWSSIKSSETFLSIHRWITIKVDSCLCCLVETTSFAQSKTPTSIQQWHSRGFNILLGK